MKELETEQLLSEEFLYDLYRTCLDNEYVLATVSQHVESKFLPDRDFQAIHRTFCDYFRKNKRCPTAGLMHQSLPKGRRSTPQLLEDVFAEGNVMDSEDALTQIERFIRQVRFQAALQESVGYLGKGASEQAQNVMAKYTAWADGFGLLSTEFVDVVKEFRPNFHANRQRHNASNRLKPVSRFYIDELDERNGGRSLRGQHTCFLASSGVGKSHIARWIGKSACLDGLSVLHIQLEGRKEEAVDAYSASFANCSAFLYENGLLENARLDEIVEELESVKGTLHVKAFPKFEETVTLATIHRIIQDYKKRYGHAPDTVVIDSMDLVEDEAGGSRNEKAERIKRIKVARGLKDIADDENLWMVSTYQSTIEDRDKLNDENFVLTEYNCSEAKGLVRPLSHLITLNQSDREDRENTMRLNVAKSRFFKKGKPIRIATDYDHEQFYDRQRTLNMAKMD